MERIQELYLPFRSYRTYVRIVNPEGKKPPLLLLHGGPGSTHNSFELLDEAAFLDDRPFVMYDQVGCGLSFVPGKHPELFQAPVWEEELENVLRSLSLPKYHLMGHSWGGMLLLLFVLDHKPEGLLSVHLSSTLSSSRLWKEETHRLIRYLPESDQEAILEAEKDGDYDSAEFQIATQHYLERYVGDLSGDSLPSCLTRKKVSGKEAYLEAWGPSEFTPLGSLKDYDVTERLKEITAPALVTSGTDDESTPLQNKILFEGLSSDKKEWVLLPSARHRTYLDQKEAYMKAMIQFLDATD